MIKKINKIENFGVLKNFRWNSELSDFSAKNIIYGWNYSGKTTLSRLFDLFDRKSLEGCTGLRFEIEDSNGNKYTESDINKMPFQIKVFNSDFIKKNLKWDGESFQPILLLGKENIETEQLLNELKNRLDGFITNKSNIALQLKQLSKEISDQKTEKAKEIRIKLQLLEPFDRSHLEKIIKLIGNTADSYLITEEDKIKESLKIATTTIENVLTEISQSVLNLKFKELRYKANQVLEEVPEISNTIQYLKENSIIADWVEKGLELHKEKNKCEFCGNTIKSDRLHELQAHFSKDLKNHRAKIAELINSLEKERQSINLYSERSFYPQLHKQYKRSITWIKEKESLYNEQLDHIISMLKEKYSYPFSSQSLDHYSDYSDDLESAISILNVLIAHNNSISNSFESVKIHQIETLKYHFIAEFVINYNLITKIKKVEILESQIRRYENIVSTLEGKIVQLNASISNVQKGKEELNTYISQFLGRDDIKIDIIIIDGKERFKIKRKNSDATNLSEGEKTAIAFSFYLTKLQEIKISRDVIVYVDDPVSSLDSNHIYHIYHLISDTFFYYDENEGKNGAYKLKFDQIFISTHNFELLSLLKKLPNNQQFIKGQYFEIKRINESESAFSNMCPLFIDFESEYNYLFKIINEHNSLEDIKKHSDPNLLILPNAIRKFVETYTLTKIPTNISVERRAKRIFGAQGEEILKFLHHHSHAENIEMISHHDTSILNLSLVCKNIIGWLSEHDSQHYEALIESIKN